MEAAELKQGFLGHGNIPYQKVQQIVSILDRREVTSYYDLKQRLESATDIEFARVMPLLENLDDKPLSPDLILKEEFTVITDTSGLCTAGIKSGNPIELLW